MKLRCDFLLVFAEMLDFFDIRRVDVFELLSSLMDAQDVVVEPLAFYEQHLQLLSLLCVQPLFDNLAFIDFADLMLPLQLSSCSCSSD